MVNFVKAGLESKSAFAFTYFILGIAVEAQ